MRARRMGGLLALLVCRALVTPAIALADPTCEGETALRWAAAQGDVATASALLDRGVPPNPSRTCPHYRTPLDIAAERRHLELVELLVRHGGRRFYASMYAIGQHDDPEIVAAILADAPGEQRQQLLDDALAVACQRGRARVVRFLLGEGANPDASYPRTGGEAPLPAAAQLPDPEILDALFRAGATATPITLFSAAGAGRPKSVERLLARVPDPHYADNDGNALSRTAASSRPARPTDYDVIGALLLERGLDPNLTHRGIMPLSWARENANEALAERLRDAGAREGTTFAYKLDRVKKTIRGAAYLAILMIGGGH